MPREVADIEGVIFPEAYQKWTDGRTLAIAPHHVGDAGYTPSIIFRPASQSHRHKWHSAFCSDKHTPQPAVAAAALTSADIENSAARRPACPPVCLPD